MLEGGWCVCMWVNGCECGVWYCCPAGWCEGVVRGSFFFGVVTFCSLATRKKERKKKKFQTGSSDGLYMRVLVFRWLFGYPPFSVDPFFGCQRCTRWKMNPPDRCVCMVLSCASLPELEEWTCVCKCVYRLVCFVCCVLALSRRWEPDCPLWIPFFCRFLLGSVVRSRFWNTARRRGLEGRLACLLALLCLRNEKRRPEWIKIETRDERAERRRTRRMKKKRDAWR